MADPRFFKNNGPYKLEDLAEIGGCELIADNPSREINDVAPLDRASEKDITFLSNKKYKDDLKTSKAGACILDETVKALAPEGMNLLISKNPYKSYALIAQAFYPLRDKDNRKTKFHEQALIHPTAKIGEAVKIGAFTVIGENVVIGDGTIIDSNVTITHAEIGQKCRIFPGVKIGQDGFGFAMDPAGQHVTVPQLGRVMVEDFVEIGANTTIDRGAGPDTVIGQGTRIDNLVQIGHNVKIGKNCVIIAQVGIAGSTVIEDYAVVAAQTGVAGHLTIGQGAQIGAKSGVVSDIPAGSKFIGTPAKPVRDFWQEQSILKRLISERKASLKKSS